VTLIPIIIRKIIFSKYQLCNRWKNDFGMMIYMNKKYAFIRFYSKIWKEDENLYYSNSKFSRVVKIQ
jgi:hypothetical protein